MSRSLKKIVENAFVGMFLVLLVSALTYSCESTKPPKAEITIVDSTGKAIDEARVVLHCVQRPEETRECVVIDTQLTDGVGKAYFEFENPAVLKVEVWKEDVVIRDTGTFPNTGQIKIGDTLCTEGFITLENDEVIEQRMIVNICNAE